MARCPACGVTFLGRAGYGDHRLPWANGWIGAECRPPAAVGLTSIRQVGTDIAVWVRHDDLRNWIGA